jgi:diguanylate cyclase (GGDEF)-like protein
VAVLMTTYDEPGGGADEARPNQDQAEETTALWTVNSALRSLLRATNERDAVARLLDTVRQLGGQVVPARRADNDVPIALPLDLAFGLDEPLLPAAPPATVARAQLERHLPSLIEDVRLIVEHLRAEDRLAEDATTDPLTGLSNRRGLARTLERLRPGSAVAVLDLDHFKRLNDEHGHAAGDQVLVALGRMLRDELRLNEQCARFGGEEFVVAFPGTTGAEAAQAIERLRGAWAQCRPWPVTFSTGVAEIGASEPLPDVLHRADNALYQAKSLGRDRVQVVGQEGAHEPHAAV